MPKLNSALSGPLQLQNTGSATEWQRILDLDRPFEYQAGSPLFAQGGNLREVFLLASGMVKLTHTRLDGRETILSLRYPGQWLEPYAPGIDMIHLLSATTLTRSEIFRLDARHFQAALSQNLQALHLLLSAHALDFYRQAETMAQLKTLSARERFEQLLAQLASSSRMDGHGGARIRLPLRDHEIASLLGISKQHFSVVKGQMILEGVLIQENESTLLLPGAQTWCASALA
jgi:CRP-like cAMP-binding protein